MKFAPNLAPSKPWFVLVAQLLCLGRQADGGNTQYSSTTQDAGPGSIIFQDDFDYFDPYVWRHMVRHCRSGNYEFQMYVNDRDITYARDGILYIKPALTSAKFGNETLTNGTISLYTNSPGTTCNDPVTSNCIRNGTTDMPICPIRSARLETIKSFCFRYGRVEVRAKLPRGDWLWPAIWLMPRDNYYGSWPRSGEIDILESRGNVNLTNGVHQAGFTLHFGPSSSMSAWRNAHFEKTLADGATFNDEFHNFGMDWTPDCINFTLDGVPVGSVCPGDGGFYELGKFPSGTENPWTDGGNLRMAPFDMCFYLILNVAVGGITGYFPDTPNKPWRNSDANATSCFLAAQEQWYPTWEGEDSAFQVDYVRVYAV